MASLEEIARRHGASLILQFGSTVDGETHERSDVDIGVLFDQAPPSLFDLGELISDLEECFPGRRVDLAVLDRADPLFLHQVLSRHRLLAGARQRLAELEIYAFKRYQDHRRYLPLERAYVDGVLETFGR